MQSVVALSLLVPELPYMVEMFTFSACSWRSVWTRVAARHVSLAGLCGRGELDETVRGGDQTQDEVEQNVKKYTPY